MKNMVCFRKWKVGWIVALLATTGCAEYHKRMLLYNTCEAGNEFTKALSKEYEALGRIEQEIMYDEGSADYYYCKAIRSKEGFCVGPTTLDKWDIEKDKCEELAAARLKLTQLFLMGARVRAPEATAHAQAHFDCWVEQQSEGWQVADIAWCRAEFHKAISEVESVLRGNIAGDVPSD
jgi:OOP family OmpA-OmpF porin